MPARTPTLRNVGSLRRAGLQELPGGIPVRACNEAGCRGRVLHDFRRTAVRNLVRAGIPERVAMQMTGRKTRSVFERYNMESVGDLGEAARRLDIATGTISATIEESAIRLESLKSASPCATIVSSMR